MQDTHIERERKMHHEALELIYRQLNPSEQDIPTGLSLWRKLRRIEKQASQVIEQYSNGDITTDQFDEACITFRAAVSKVFNGHTPTGFFINSDPRGYALKLEPKSYTLALHTDWGGYQILAPEIN